MAAMGLPVLHPRTPQFGAMLAEVQEGLCELFGTGQDVLVLAASGTGAMEGSVTNLLSPGDEVVVVNGGKFGERWTKICQGYGVVVHEVVVEWGRAVETAAVARALEAHPKVRAVFAQASETSTCVLHPVPALAELTRRRDVLLVVDGITAVGVVDLPMDRLGIDVLVTGSQKALMLPPGLAFAALSERASAATDRMRVTFAGGQDRLKGKVIRIAHLGYVDAFDVVTGVAALELALRHFGAPVELGRGVGAAEAVLAEGLPAR